MATTQPPLDPSPPAAGSAAAAADANPFDQLGSDLGNVNLSGTSSSFDAPPLSEMPPLPPMSPPQSPPRYLHPHGLLDASSAPSLPGAGEGGGGGGGAPPPPPAFDDPFAGMNIMGSTGAPPPPPAPAPAAAATTTTPAAAPAQDDPWATPSPSADAAPPPPAAAAADPFASDPTASAAAGQVVPSTAPSNDPYGVLTPPVPPGPTTTADPSASSAYASASGGQMVPSTAPPSDDPYGVFAAGGAATAGGAVGLGGVVDPSSPLKGSLVYAGSLVPHADPLAPSVVSPAVSPPSSPRPAPQAAAAEGPGGGGDPFGLFGAAAAGGAAAAEAAPAPAPPLPLASEDDELWSSMSMGPVGAAAHNEALKQQASAASAASPAPPVALDESGLPSSGTTYESRVNTETFGALFYEARDLTQGLLSKTDRELVKGLGERPIVAYVVQGSACDQSGVNLGDVLLSVNGKPAKDPQEARHLIVTEQRPLVMKFFASEGINVTIAEGKHMVKYDAGGTGPPEKPNEWKPKYVVVGGIIAKRYQLNMFRSRAEYDAAVKETMKGVAGQPVRLTIKVKQFDLRRARLLNKNDTGKSSWVHYTREAQPRHYFTILPAKGFPIKISSPDEESLRPVFEAVAKCLEEDRELMGERDNEVWDKRAQYYQLKHDAKSFNKLGESKFIKQCG